MSLVSSPRADFHTVFYVGGAAVSSKGKPGVFDRLYNLAKAKSFNTRLITPQTIRKQRVSASPQLRVLTAQRSQIRSSQESVLKHGLEEEFESPVELEETKETGAEFDGKNDPENKAATDRDFVKKEPEESIVHCRVSLVSPSPESRKTEPVVSLTPNDFIPLQPTFTLTSFPTSISRKSSGSKSVKVIVTSDLRIPPPNRPEIRPVHPEIPDRVPLGSLYQRLVNRTKPQSLIGGRMRKATDPIVTPHYSQLSPTMANYGFKAGCRLDAWKKADGMKEISNRKQRI